MAGKYIINQTAGKRYIVLEEDAEKIEGGYFDTEGDWHDLSGPLDGDLVGRYVINETGGKRIIILQEDAEDIGGGYFEEDGTWISFVSSSYPITIMKGEPFFAIAAQDTSKPNNDPPYLVFNNSYRVSILGPDALGFPVTYGKSYRVTFNTEYTDLFAEFKYFNQSSYEQLANKEVVSVVNLGDTGWMNLNGSNTITFTPQIVDNMEPVAFWINLKRTSSGNVAFTDLNLLDPVTIEEIEL